MTFTAYTQQHVLDQIFGATAWSAPATLYVALSTAAYTATVAEPSGNAYARVAVTNNSTNWPASTGSNPASKSNGTSITFPTATGSWGTIQSWAIYDASTGGNCLDQAALDVNKTIGSGDTLAFAVGALTTTLQ